MSFPSAPLDRHVKRAQHGWAVEMGVIKDARRRQCRRRLALAMVLLAGAGIAAFGAVGSGRRVGSQPPARPRPGTRSGSGVLISPARVFAQEPYMGVACSASNSMASCNRPG